MMLLPSSKKLPTSVIIVGAGLAGCLLAERLIRKGCAVTLIEESDSIASAASGNPLGEFSPLLTKDPQQLPTRFTWACYHYWQDLLRNKNGNWHSLPHQFGAIHLLRSDAALVQYANTNADASHVQLCAAKELANITGLNIHQDGFWLPFAGSVSPRAMCHHAIALAKKQSGPSPYSSALLKVELNKKVQAVATSNGSWVAHLDDGAAIHADKLVLTNSYYASTLLPTWYLPLQAVRGQLTGIPSAQLPSLNTPYAISQESYVLPNRDGIIWTGATFGRDDTNTEITPNDHMANLQGLSQLLPSCAKDIALLDNNQLLGRASIRATTPDHLPMVGQLFDNDLADLPEIIRKGTALRKLPRKQGLFCMLGLGSRGITYSPLMAEVLACQITTQIAETTSAATCLIAQDLMDAVDPARFILRKLRRV